MLYKYRFFYFGRAPPGRAIRFKSSHFLRQAVGFPLLSLTQTVKQELLFTKPNNYPQSCHFDEGEISVSNSTTRV
jgi:hypothetical protein